MTTKTQRNGRILPRKWIDITLQSLEGTAALLAKMKLTPNAVTILALFAGIAAGYYFAISRPLGAVLFILLSGTLDILDGKVAKHRGETSKFGAIFDSTLDRYSEFALYLGLAYYFRDHWALWVTFFTFLGSTMVSYTRARAEGLGIECRVGIMHRAERMIILVIAGLVGHFFDIFDPVMIGTLILIAVVSNFTAWQRTFYVRKVERQNN